MTQANLSGEEVLARLVMLSPEARSKVLPKIAALIGMELSTLQHLVEGLSKKHDAN